MVLKKEITLQIKNLLKENPQGLRITDIVKKVDINRNTAGRYLENLLVSGQVEMRRFGMAKIYSLSQRVPLSALLSISSELVIQLDSSLRIIFANEPFILLVGTDSKSLVGKNIEYTPVALVFEDFFPEFIEHLRKGVSGKEWVGEISLRPKDVTLFCRIAPTVFDDGRKGVTIILEDITQRKEAEQKVEESERQFRLLAENSLDMISRIKPDGTRLYVSPAYKTTLGYEPEELIGKGNDDFIHPKDAHVMESLRNILTHENPSATVTFRTKHKDGHYIWIESAVKAIFDENTRELSEYYTVTRDITERKRAEDTLQESEDRYRKLVEISPDAVFLHREGKIIYANPAAFKLVGASHSYEMIGKNILDFIHPDFRDAIRKNIEKDLGGTITPPMELQMLRMDGTSIIVEGRGVKTNIDGKPAVQVAIRDITERKHAEEALRDSEGKLNAMLQSIADPMSMMDQDLTIIWANEPAKRYFGKDIIGKKCYEAYHLRPAPCEPYPCLTLKAFLDGKTHQHEITVIDNQGEKRFFECTANVALRDNSGKPVAVLETSRDITNRKKAEEALRESEEKYRTLIDRANDGICVVQDSIVKMCNRYLAVLWGGSVEQILGKDITEFIHPDALLEIVNRYNRRMAGQPTPSIYETVLKRKDGSRFYAELNAGIVSYEGTPADFIIIRDMNDRKKAQTALRESEERLRLILNSTDDLIIMQDLQGRYLYFNSATRYGVAVDEMLGLTPYDFLDRESADQMVERLKKVAKTGQNIREKTPLVWKGQTLWFSDSLSPVRDANGTITTVVTVSQNITERKRAEEALRESEEMYRTLAESSNDLIFVIGRDDRVEYTNSFAAALLNKPVEQITGRPRTSFFPPDVAVNQKKGLEKIFETGISVRSEGSLTLNDRVYWFDHLLTPLKDPEGKIRSVLGISRDITERKYADTQLQNSEQRFQRLLELSFDAITIYKNKKIAFLNEKAAKILGAASPQDLIGRSILDFVHPDSIRDVVDRVQKISTDSGAPVPVIPEKFLRVDGITVNVEVMAISFEDNGLPAVQVAFREITSRDIK
jgi:PAS domain S-box-containing protein